MIEENIQPDAAAGWFFVAHCKCEYSKRADCKSARTGNPPERGNAAVQSVVWSERLSSMSIQTKVAAPSKTVKTINTTNAIICQFYEILLLTNALYDMYPIAAAAIEPEPTSHQTLISSFITEERTTPAKISFEISSKYLLRRK